MKKRSVKSCGGSMHARRSWLAIFKIGVTDALAYRADFVMAVVSALTLVFVQYYLWQAVYAHREHIQGFSVRDTITYMSLVWATAGFYDVRWVARQMQEKLLAGTLMLDILYPINFQVYTCLLAYARNVTHLVLSGTPVLLVAWGLLGARLPAPGHAIMFLISMHLAFLISAGLAFLLGLASIYAKQTEGLIQLEGFVATLASGALVPLAFLPAPLAAFTRVLPYAFVVWAPQQIYLGKATGSEASLILVWQLLWATLIHATAAWWTQRALKQAGIFGG